MLSIVLCFCPVVCSSLFFGAWCWRLRAQVHALSRVSTLDPLTGLPNGLMFEAERWPAAVRGSLPLAVLFIDLDHLKLHNDRHGRLAGDHYITRAAALLRQTCRRGVDPIFRLHTAGDEFVVLLFGDDALHCETVAQHVLCTLVREYISASIGVAWTRATNHRQRARIRRPTGVFPVPEPLRHATGGGHPARPPVTAPGKT